MLNKCYESGWMGMTLIAEVMSTLVSHEQRFSSRSLLDQCCGNEENYTNKMLRSWELYWAERSIIKHFLPENVLIATSKGLIRKHLNG